MTFTSFSGWVAAKVPFAPSTLVFHLPSSVEKPPKSELSSPTMGTICVSLLKGPTAAAPK